MSKPFVTFKLAKLVRDKLPELFRQLNHKANYHQLEGDMLLDALKLKIIEEASELPLPNSDNREKQLSELGDVLQAFQDTVTARGFTMSEVETAKSVKYAEKGGFKDGCYVETVSVPSDDEKWLTYYRNDPKRFPEIDSATTKNIIFVTGNQNKADLHAAHLGVPLMHQKLELDEVQSFSLHEIAEHKARQAYDIVKQPVLIEDSALTFHALGKLPGPFIKWFLQELTLQQLCDFVPADNRGATAAICYCLYDGTSVTFFNGEVSGTITTTPRGEGGFGYDPIFVIDGQPLTNAEMDHEEYARYSLRTTKIFPELRRYLTTVN